MPTARQSRLQAGALVATIAALGGATGCGGSGGSGGSGSAEPSQVTPAKPTAAAAADVRRPTSASSVVELYWGYLQDGALPGALDLYDPAVNRAIGVSRFSGALASERQVMKLKVIKVERARKGALVTVELKPPTGPTTRESFYLRRGKDGRWSIRYDSLTAAALQAYVVRQTQYRIGPAKTPSPPAIQAGDVTLARFRAVGLR